MLTQASVPGAMTFDQLQVMVLCCILLLNLFKHRTIVLAKDIPNLLFYCYFTQLPFTNPHPLEHHIIAPAIA